MMDEIDQGDIVRIQAGKRSSTEYGKLDGMAVEFVGKAKDTTKMRGMALVLADNGEEYAIPIAHLRIPKRVFGGPDPKGRMPGHTIFVGYGTEWDNPFKVQRFEGGVYRVRTKDGGTVWGPESELAAQTRAVRLYESWLLGGFLHDGCSIKEPGGPIAKFAAKELRGKNLSTRIPPRWPCHADVLLRIANKVGEDE